MVNSILKNNEAKYHGKRRLMHINLFIGSSQGNTDIPSVAAKISNMLMNQTTHDFVLVLVLLFHDTFYTSLLLSVDFLHLFLFPLLALLFL